MSFLPRRSDVLRLIHRQAYMAFVCRPALRVDRTPEVTFWRRGRTPGSAAAAAEKREGERGGCRG